MEHQRIGAIKMRHEVKRGSVTWRGVELKNEQVWECKIGGAIPQEIQLRGSFDLEMRKAVANAYYEITGRTCDYLFSGWNAELTEAEIKCIEGEI
jgi:hypothetical protein